MPVTPAQAAAWEAEGRRLAPALDPVAAVIVAGTDVDAAAHLALGLAAGQATRRRVAVADLTGQATPLAALVPDDDPHGLSDALAFGVSLNRIARQLDQQGRLFVIPAGTESALRPDLAASDRWRRIADGFRDVGALLLLVAPSGTPGLAGLVQRMDGAVTADDEPASAALPHRITTAVPRESPTSAAPRAPVVTPVQRARPMRVALYVAIGLVVIAGLVWAASRMGGGSRGGSELFMRSDSAAAEIGTPLDTSDTASATLSTGDSTAAPTSSDSLPADDALEPPVANPEDLTRAAAFTVAVATLPSEAAAVRAFRDRSRALAAVTIGQAADSGGTAVYYVVSGGGQQRAAVEGELARLRRQGIVSADLGAVVRLPYALQVESSVSPDSVRMALNRFLARGIPAYAMLQPNRRAHIYVGAFATPTDARTQLVGLQAADIPAALAVRTGRPL